MKTKMAKLKTPCKNVDIICNQDSKTTNSINDKNKIANTGAVRCHQTSSYIQKVLEGAISVEYIEPSKKEENH